MADDIDIKVHVLPHQSLIYLNDVELIQMVKHPTSIIHIEPYSDPDLFPGQYTVKYKGKLECSTVFSEIVIDQNCADYIDRPIDISLAKVVSFVI